MRMSAFDRKLQELLAANLHTMQLLDCWMNERPYSDLVFRSTRYAYNLPAIDETLLFAAAANGETAARKASSDSPASRKGAGAMAQLAAHQAFTACPNLRTF